MRVLVVLSMSVLLSACGKAINSAATSSLARSQAEAIAERFFENARASDWTGAEALYHPRFFESMPLETWRRILPNVERELGKLGDCTQQSWNVTKNTSTSFVGTLVTLHYQCEHERYTSDITFTIGRASGESEYMIYGQNLNSIGFLIE